LEGAALRLGGSAALQAVSASISCSLNRASEWDNCAIRSPRQDVGRLRSIAGEPNPEEKNADFGAKR
jgi:hypothetical protein